MEIMTGGPYSSTQITRIINDHYGYLNVSSVAWCCILGYGRIDEMLVAYPYRVLKKKHWTITSTHGIKTTVHCIGMHSLQTLHFGYALCYSNTSSIKAQNHYTISENHTKFLVTTEKTK
jgi:hypothetical protein